jgi:hypothetical protein
VPPEDIAIMHWERYEYPTGQNADGTSNWDATAITKKKQHRVVVHARYKCVVDRYGTCFKTSMLKILEPHRLSQVHWDHLWQQLGVNKTDYI